MKAWVVRSPGPIDGAPLAFVDRPMPAPGPGEVGPRVTVCGVGRTDLHLAEGEENRLAILNWQKSYSPRSDRRHVAAATEYVLVYARDNDKAKTGLLSRTEVMDARYSSPDGDPRVWKGGDLSAKKAKKNQGMVYAIQSPFTGELPYPLPGSCWRLAQRELPRALEEWGAAYKAVALDDDAERAALIGVDKEGCCRRRRSCSPMPSVPPPRRLRIGSRAAAGRERSSAPTAPAALSSRSI